VGSTCRKGNYMQGMDTGIKTYFTRMARLQGNQRLVYAPYDMD